MIFWLWAWKFKKMEKIALDIHRKILIPTDYSPACNNAVAYGMEFCRIYGCSAEVFHVSVGEDDKADSSSFTSRTISYYKDKYGIDTDFVVTKGSVTQRIANETLVSVFGFVVLGTPGNNGFQRLTGSYAAKIIDLVSAPVIVVQNKSFKKIENIVLALSSDVEKIDGGKIAAVVNFFEANVHIMYSDEKVVGLRNMDKLVSSKNIRYKKISPSINSVLQALNYCRDIDADLLISVSTASSSQSLRNEQLVFNVMQMPVMCLSI